jgi:hypothetical protein
LSHNESLVSKSYDARIACFLPRADTCLPYETWWELPPGLIVEFVRILGFGEIEVSSHSQLCQGREVELYTVVGRRRS